MTDPHQLLALGAQLQNAGQIESALIAYDELLSAYLGTAQVHTNRGLALFELGRFDDAIAAYRAAVQSDPSYFDAHYSMGLALFATRQFVGALASFDAALSIRTTADAYVSRGSTHLELMQHEAALLDYDAALAINPNFANAHMNKGSALYEMQREDEALACFERALLLQPNDHATQWNEALCLLRAGNFQRGWPRYERRLEGSLSEPLRRSHYGKPRHLRAAADLAGKTILLWPEQGHGDVMQFCRYALELQRVGANVILEVYPPLLRLMQTAFAGTRIRVALDGSTDDSQFDVHSPLLSLPLICGTDSIIKIPAPAPYLFAQPSLVQPIQGEGLRVGLVWAGGYRPNQPIDVKVDAARSIKLDMFVPLLALSQTMPVQFVSLQAGAASAQMQTLAPGLMAHGLPEISQGDILDWVDTAAVIAGLDLVISVDTAAAHLAAAMGKPTWILSRFNGCWRWMQDRTDSPWYPSARLFRQKTRGDWAGVVDEVTHGLTAVLQNASIMTAIHTNQGLALWQQGQLEAAITCYDRAIACDSQNAAAHNERGVARVGLGQKTLALADFDAALALNPALDAARQNRAPLLLDFERYEEAASEIDHLLAHGAVLDALTHYNHGLARQACNQFALAILSYEACVHLDAGHVNARWNDSQCRLALGDYAEGWRKFEWRWQSSNLSPYQRRYAQPLWLGETSLVGKTILLWPDQGFGDVIQFVRYALVVQQMGARVLLATRPPLLRLFEQSFLGTGVVVVPDGDELAFDCHAPLMSLPLACGTDGLQNIPNNGPYIFAKRSSALQPTQDHVLRVGVVWAGGHRPNQPELHAVDAARSVKLAQFAPLLALAKTSAVQFFSLQLGQQSLQGDSPMIDLTADLHDWADTAALIAHLDLVISVDTAVAHLAGAMGKPTWILSRFNGCWRWLTDRDDSPWYPTARLFRQRIRGDWEEVVLRVTAALQDRLGQDPNDAEASFNRGVVLDDLERFDEALACYLRALEINPEHPKANQNASLLLLRQGDFASGWRAYEKRWLVEQTGIAWLDLPRPVWRGESLQGKAILLWCEQGVGDAFQFCRYAFLLRDLGAKVSVLVLDSKVQRLFEQSFKAAGIDVVNEVAFRLGQLVPAFDVHSSLMSLPLAYGTDSLSKIPAGAPYLFADPIDIAKWHERLLPIVPQTKRRIGLVWAGGAFLGYDRERSIRLEQFEPLLALSQTKGAQFLSLQLGEPAQQLQGGYPVIDLTDELTDWADTAALIANLDLVISVDTAVAHLAAAMGKPTWILSRYNGCWRWLEDRDDSPWYPTVRLFRQKTKGAWAGVMAEVSQALQMELASYNA